MDLERSINLIVDGILSSWEAISALGCIAVIPLILTVPTFVGEDVGTGTLIQVG